MGSGSMEPRDEAIAAIEASTCRFLLPEPIVLEDFEIRSREYVVVRVVTTSGLEGVAWSLTRGAPMAQVIDSLVAPLAVGQDAFAIPALLERFERQLSLLGTDGLVQRAISLLDIALWDIRGKAFGAPVWRLLGGYRTVAPTLLVDAYPGPDGTDGLIEGIVRRAGEGYPAMKLHSHADPEVTTALLAGAREAVGSAIEFVVDVSMSWRDTREGLSAIGRWAPYHPAWIEDPFRGEKSEMIRFLRQRSSVPIGAGDEVANPLAIKRLITTGAVDVVRLDATCQGGFSGFAALAGLAIDHGVRDLPPYVPRDPPALRICTPWNPAHRTLCSGESLRLH